MTDSGTASAEEWGSMVEDFNEAVMRAVEDNVAAQAAIAERWMETAGDSVADEVAEDAVEGYARAYRAWMGAAQEGFERTSDALDGEDVPPEEFRDIWLNAANDAFKEVMSTTAFAAATGETVSDVLGLAEQVDEATGRALHNAGLPTADDVREVGERLVELERRQHAVEGKLDGLDRLSEMDRQLDRLEDLDRQIARLEEAGMDELDRLAEMDEELDRLAEMDEKLNRLEAVDEKLDRLAEMDEELDRLEAVDEKLDRLEAMDGKLDRLEEVDEKLDRLAEMDERLDRLEEVDEKLDRLVAATEEGEDE